MILVYAEHKNGIFGKRTFEALTYGKRAAAALGTVCHALVLNETQDAGSLGQYGAAKVLQVSDPALNHFDSQVYARVIADVAKSNGAKLVVVAHSSAGKALLGRLAVRLDAGSASSVQDLQVEDGNIRVRRSAFSGKAIAWYDLSGGCNVVSLMGNALPPDESGAACEVEQIAMEVIPGKITVRETKTLSGTVPLPEAELVVSAGRGMKEPSNWGIIEELAETLGATLACSRPVADSGWRPHHEHVGQTGIAIRPNLYIAIGISGAIQHLAGVNNSKVIVVINKDPEAPFFKAADYGVCADLFDVVPKLTASIKVLQQV